MLPNPPASSSMKITTACEARAAGRHVELGLVVLLKIPPRPLGSRISVALEANATVVSYDWVLGSPIGRVIGPISAHREVSPTNPLVRAIYRRPRSRPKSKTLAARRLSARPKYAAWRGFFVNNWGFRRVDEESNALENHRPGKRENWGARRWRGFP